VLLSMEVTLNLFNKKCHIYKTKLQYMSTIYVENTTKGIEHCFKTVSRLNVMAKLIELHFYCDQ